MATRAIGADSVSVTLPPHFAPMPTVMRTLAKFDRESLEGFITVAISLLDIVDGDADYEDNCMDRVAYSDAAAHDWPTLRAISRQRR